MKLDDFLKKNVTQQFLGFLLEPGSHPGDHSFSELSRPYDVDVNTVVHNYKRLAELWAEDVGLMSWKMLGW